MDKSSKDGCDRAQPSREDFREGAARSAPYPQRKHPVHIPLREIPNRANIVFVTVCSKKRKAIFAHHDVLDQMVKAWCAADKWLVGKYVIMPNHVHFFCAPASRGYPALQVWVKYWKTLVSREWPRPEEQPIWQNDFWDTQLRRGDSYSEKWNYVRNNPVRAGLVRDPGDWPFAGELNRLRWSE